MARKKIGKNRGSGPSTAPELRERIARALERGKGRQALDAAKVLAKLEPGEGSDALLLDSYQARILELSKAGFSTDARRLVDTVKARFPEAAATLDRTGLKLEASAGDLDGVLRRLGAPDLEAEERDTLTEILRRSVRDPAEVAESDALPSGHPLKEDARRVADLLRRSASAPLARDDPALTAVSRRSPFVAFVFLARAIDAAYRGDGTGMEALLGKIPEDCAAARAAPALRALAVRKLDPGLSPATRRLLGAVLGEDRELGSLLIRLEEAITAVRPRAVRIAVEVRQRLSRAAPGLLPEFRRVLSSAWTARDLDLVGLWEALGASLTEEAEYWRVLALAMEVEGFTEDALDNWESYLAGRGGPTSPLEVAAVRRRQAALARHIELEDANDIVHWAGWDPEQDADEGGFLGSFDASPVRSAAYMEQAVGADPSSSNYADLHRLYDLDPASDAARDVAERWRAAHPREIGPLLALVKSLKIEGPAHERRLLAILEEAHEIAPHDPRVREARRDALIGSARRSMRSGRRDEARRTVAQLRECDPTAPEQFCWFLDLLSWFAEDEGEARAGIFGRLREAVGDGPARYLLNAAAPLLDDGRLALSVPPRPALAPPAAVSRALATAQRVLGGAGFSVPRDRDALAALTRALGRGFTPEDADLETLGDLYLDLDIVGGLHHISRIGLSSRPARRHWFLFLRAMGLGYSKARAKRRLDCLLAARELALRVGDERAVAEVGGELEFAWVGEGLAPGEAEQILAREARAGPADAPGHKPHRGDPKQGRLFT